MMLYFKLFREFFQTGLFAIGGGIPCHGGEFALWGACEKQAEFGLDKLERMGAGSGAVGILDVWR